jgi:deoxyribonucleoside regulator
MSYNKELIFEVAKLYYLDDFKQEKIARRLNISKYKVGRVLRRAKDLGAVQIKIIKPNDNKRLK